MKFLTIVSCSLVAAGIAYPAGAGAFGQETGSTPPVQDQRPRPDPQRGAERPQPQRDMRGMGQGDRGRMSPDERQQLRRDIRDAGKDIYRPGRDARSTRRQGRN